MQQGIITRQDMFIVSKAGDKHLCLINSAYLLYSYTLRWLFRFAISPAVLYVLSVAVEYPPCPRWHPCVPEQIPQWSAAGLPGPIPCTFPCWSPGWIYEIKNLLRLYHPFTIHPAGLWFRLERCHYMSCCYVQCFRKQTCFVFYPLHFSLENRWWALSEEGWQDSDLWHRLHRCMEGKSIFTLSACMWTSTCF